MVWLEMKLQGKQKWAFKTMFIKSVKKKIHFFRIDATIFTTSVQVKKITDSVA